MIRSILSSAAETFAGVFGFLSRRSWGRSPPAPPRRRRRRSPAWRAPSPPPTSACGRCREDMLTLVHHNELDHARGARRALFAIMLERRRARRAAQRGPPCISIRPPISTSRRVDSGSVAQWMRSNSSRMMKAIDEAVRHGARLGLRRLVGGLRRGHGLRRRRASPAVDRRVRLRHDAHQARSVGGRSRSADQYVLRAGRNEDRLFLLRSTSCRPRIPNARRSRSSAPGSSIRKTPRLQPVYPSTNFIGGAFEQWNGAAWVADDWRWCRASRKPRPGLIPIPTLRATSFVYGGTPSDQSIVRCIRDLKSARLQGRLLSVPARDRGRAFPGAGASPIRPTSRAPRRARSTPSSARRRPPSSRRTRSI